MARFTLHWSVKREDSYVSYRFVTEPRSPLTASTAAQSSKILRFEIAIRCFARIVEKVWLLIN